MKWNIAVAVYVCVVLTKVALPKSINTTAVTSIKSEKSNQSSVHVKRVTANVSSNKKIIVEDVYNVFLCKENGSVIVRVGWTIRFACGLNGLLNETLVRWFKDEKELSGNNNEPRNNENAGKWMEITNVSSRHSGEYSCSFNQKTCRSNILVKDKLVPVISAGKQFLWVKKDAARLSILVGSNATFYRNGSVTLVCNASGYPSPTITWSTNEQVIDKGFETMGIIVQSNSLILTNVALLTGAYTCTASNRFGTGNAISFIKYEDPETPEILSDFKDVVVTENHGNTTITVGANVTVYGQSVLVLTCNASGSPPPVIHWTKNGRKMSVGQAIENKLFLAHDPVHSGEYCCVAINFIGKANLSSNIRFIEPIKPMIVSSRKKLFAINGENHVYLKVGDDLTTIAGTAVEIQCLASGIPKPDISWYHNGHACQNSRLISLSDENYFYNKAITPNASGNYTCVAKNAFGYATATSYINAIEPVIPYINSSSEDIISYDMTHPLGKIIGGSIKSLVGVSIWLECPMGGIPRPEISWEKDNLPISSGKRIKVSRKRIVVLGTIMSDNGWYSCIVSNGAGTVTEATFVHLIAPEKPRVNSARRRSSYIVNFLPTPFSAQVGIDLRVLAHRKITIYCSATGFPVPQLSWRKNGRPIVEKDKVFVSESGDKLVFPNFETWQNGAYSCIASNFAGQDSARTVITGRLPSIPKIELTKAILSKYQPSPQKNVKFYEIWQAEPLLVRGSDVLLECIARKGYPRVSFKWFKDGQPFRGKITKSFKRSKVELRNVQEPDEGRYKCFASNIVGQHQRTIELRLQRPRGFRSQ